MPTAPTKPFARWVVINGLAFTHPAGTTDQKLGIIKWPMTTLQRECLDHIIPLNEVHLRRVLSEFMDYYHQDRTHLALGKDAPEARGIERLPEGGGTLLKRDILGGLHHRYSWKKAA